MAREKIDKQITVPIAFETFFVKTFDKHRHSSQDTLKYHLLDHMVYTLRSFEMLFVCRR